VDLMNRPVIAGIDGSPESIAAARWAAEEASRHGTDLLLIHAGDWPVHTAPGSTFDVHQGRIRDLLRSVAEEAGYDHPGLTVRTTTVADGARQGLIQAGGLARMLVLGSRGLGAFRGLLVGSTALAVAANAPCPVVLVRADQPFGSALTPADVVVGVDTADPSPVVLAFAMDEAQRAKVQLRAVHAWSPSTEWYSSISMPAEAARARDRHGQVDRLRQALEPLQDIYPGVAVEPATRVGGTAEILCDEARRAGLVVVGRHDRKHGGVGRLGSVAHAVIHYARCPVAVVPRD
jgi:nucleotide-binding universal stress UspA family protein